MLIERREQRLYASHHQFYVEDGERPGDTGDASFWTKAAVADLLAVVPGTVGVGTGSYGHVRVITEIHDGEPPLSLAVWDHVAEASLAVRGSTLRVIGCLEETGEEFSVAPGTYRVRCCYENLDEGVESGEGPDWYVVQVWPAPAAPQRVLKRWSAAA
jgi:hypothetical protein